MSEMTDHGITTDLRLASATMAETNTFPTAQALMRDAAKEIERLRDEIVAIRTDRPFVMGFNEGWDSALESMNESTTEQG